MPLSSDYLIGRHLDRMQSTPALLLSSSCRRGKLSEAVVIFKQRQLHLFDREITSREGNDDFACGERIDDRSHRAQALPGLPWIIVSLAPVAELNDCTIR